MYLCLMVFQLNEIFFLCFCIGGLGLKSALIESVTKGQVSVGKDKAVVDQFRRIIDFIVQYFTHDGTNQDDDENETIEYIDQTDTEPAPKVRI